MKISSTKKLLIELLPEDVRKWFALVSGPLNTALDQYNRALTNQLTIADNLKTQKWSIVISATQDYPLKLTYKLNENPTVFHVQLLPADGSVATLTGQRIEVLNGSVELTFTGLSAVKHSLTLVAQV